MTSKIINALICHLVNIFTFIIIAPSTSGYANHEVMGLGFLAILLVNFLSFGFYIGLKNAPNTLSSWAFFLFIFIAQNMFYSMFAGFSPFLSVLKCLFEANFGYLLKFNLAINISLLAGFLVTYIYENTFSD